MAATPRTNDEYLWSLKEWEDYGGPKPRGPTVTEQAMWAEDAAIAAADDAAQMADERAAASKQYTVRAESQARSPQRLRAMRDALGTGRPLLRLNSPELQQDVRSWNDDLKRAEHYGRKPEQLLIKNHTEADRARVRAEMAALDKTARSELAALGLEPGQQMPKTRVVSRTPMADMNAALGTVAPEPLQAAEPAPTPTPEPVMAETKTKKPRAPVKTRAGDAYSRSSSSMPRVQTELFGIPPAQPSLMTGPGLAYDGALTAPSLGGSIDNMYEASGNYAQRPIGRAPSLPIPPPLPPIRYGTVPPDAPAPVLSSDLFGGRGVGPSTAYSSVMDPDPVESARKFALQPREQAALWPELDTRTQGLNRILGRAPNVLEMRPGIDSPYVPPHDPAAYAAGPQVAQRSPQTYAGQAAQFSNGPTAYDAPPSLASRAGRALTSGAHKAMGALGVLGMAAELYYTPQEDINILETAARQGRGRDMPIPVRSAPARPYVAQGEAQFGRGDGFVDPRLLRSSTTVAPAAAPQFLSDGGGFAGNSPAWSTFTPGLMVPTPDYGYRPTPVARPVARPAYRPAPMPTSSVRGGQNTNIDDETRMRALRAMGILP